MKTLSSANEVGLIRVESLALAQDGRFKEGEKLIVDTLQRQKNDRNMLGVLSQYYILTHRTNDALVALNHMLDVDPENIWGLFNKGKLLFEQQKYEQDSSFDKFMNFQSKSSSRCFTGRSHTCKPASWKTPGVITRNWRRCRPTLFIMCATAWGRLPTGRKTPRPRRSIIKSIWTCARPS